MLKKNCSPSNLWSKRFFLKLASPYITILMMAPKRFESQNSLECWKVNFLNELVSKITFSLNRKFSIWRNSIPNITGYHLPREKKKKELTSMSLRFNFVFVYSISLGFNKDGIKEDWLSKISDLCFSQRGNLCNNRPLLYPSFHFYPLF